MSFDVGQKVVCVNDAPEQFTGEPSPVKKGSIYIVAEVIKMPNGLHAINVEGVRLPDYYWGFKPARFRPVIERKTDISIFTTMLTPNRASEPVA